MTNRETVVSWLGGSPSSSPQRSPEQIDAAWRAVLYAPPDPDDPAGMLRADAFCKRLWMRHDGDPRDVMLHG